jgi:hypothetical protein
VDLDLEGRVSAASPFAADLRMRARRSSLDPFLRALAPRLPSSVGIVTTAEATVEGPLARPREIRVQAAASDLEVLFPEYPIRNRVPLRFDLEGAAGPRVRPGGRRNGPSRGGDVGLAAGGPPPGGSAGSRGPSRRGGADPGAAGTGRRPALLDVSGLARRRGPKARWSWKGRRARAGIPHGLEGVRGPCAHESAAVLSGVTGTLAGARGAPGPGHVRRGRPTSFEIRVLRPRNDAPLSGEASAAWWTRTCEFSATAEAWLTGTVDVRQALWTSATTWRRAPAAEPRLRARRRSRRGRHLDIRLQAPGTLKVDNNLAALQARAELVLRAPPSPR